MRPVPRTALFAGACALVLAACAKKEAAGEAPRLTAEVRTAVLADAAVERTVTAYGAAEFAPGAEQSLSAPIEARVAQVLAGAGSLVSAGQAVVVLSPSAQTGIDLKKAVDDARTSQQAYDRALRLKASGLDSNADVETARSANVLAQATLQSLQARTAGLTVRSPVKGVVEALTASPGDLVASGASLGKVGRLGSVRLRLALDPSAAAGVRPGETVRLTPADGGEARVGVVRSLDPRIDAQTRMASVMVDAADAALAPGRAVRGEIVVGRADGPVVPHAAIYYDQDQPYVLVVQHGVARRRNVALGAVQGEQVQLSSGARAGERIVTEGGASLDDGTPVKEAPPPAAAPDKDAGG